MSMDGLLCHCRVNPDGHEPGSVLDCEAVPVKAGTRVGWPALRTYGGDYGQTRAMPAASGTCPDCGRAGVKVVAHVVRGNHPDYPPNIRVGIRPQLAAHKRPSRGAAPCDGAGLVPAEMRFTPGADLAGWLRDYGQESVA